MRAIPGMGGSAAASSCAMALRRLAQPARELERDRERQIAERARRGVVDRHRGLRRGVEPIPIGEHLGEARTKSVMNRENHGVGCA